MKMRQTQTGTSAINEVVEPNEELFNNCKNPIRTNQCKFYIIEKKEFLLLKQTNKQTKKQK